MRALFTQFSILVGILTTLELQTRQVGTLAPVALGVAAACTVYIILLLGDYTIHKYLDEKTSAPTSIRRLDSSTSALSYGREIGVDNRTRSFEEPAVKAA